MNISNPIPSTVSSISFSFLSAENIRQLSVKQITNPVLHDELNHPTTGGLYDPALGPSTSRDICKTCRIGYFQCPGHFGHIELPSPVYHPLFMVNAYNLLRGICMYCHKFKTSRTALAKYAAKLRLLDHGLLEAAEALDDLQQRILESKDTDNDNENGADESDNEYIKRINLFVAVQLHRASSSKRDDYKDGSVYQIRKNVITEFLKSCISNNCKNCGGISYTFRKEGHTKIIEYDLTNKQKAFNSAAGRKRYNILATLRTSAHTSTESAHNEEEEESGSEGESEGEDVMSVDEEFPKPLPRAANGKVKSKRGRAERVLAPEECRGHLRRLFKNEASMVSLIYGQHGPFATKNSKGIVEASADMFFLEVIPVAPTRFRPPALMGEIVFEHPQNELLTKILNTSYRLRDLNNDLKAASAKEMMKDDSGSRHQILASLLEALVQLQVDINSFIDSNKNPALVRHGKLPPPGIKQILEKKEGLFRMHMMGKRVNYAARSVISPDVNIEPNEIGVPPVFARKLTFPEPVTQHNFREMRDLVIRGTKEYPGASMVEFEDGHIQHLDRLSLEQRTAIANQLLTPQEGTKATVVSSGLSTRTMAVNKKVHRHLRDGDTLILNRQPTLHKPSMMAHRARVLQGEKTIRMHYANCNSYNADFDGDEMNIHFPQNEIARAEAYHIANTDNQYLVATSGKPLRGLIQDHVVAGLWMTCKSTFFSREDYNQLLYGSLRPEDDLHYGNRLVTLPPAIWKPKPLWTGKQIISTILKNITPETAQGMNLKSKSQVSGLLWGTGSVEEGEVLVLDGELLCGILDKSQVGASAYGIVHSVYELYGADVAGRLLGILSRLFTKLLQHRAFTCRIDDLVLTSEGDNSRRLLRAKADDLGLQAAVENFPSLLNVPPHDVPQTLKSLLRDVLFDDAKMADLDRQVQKKMREHTRAITDACIPLGLWRRFPDNHMQAMTVSGAKGSATNAQLISCGLGQQSLEGRRVPVMVSGKTLPSFQAFETAPIAGGYVGSRFLTGIQPQEYFFHCMAGREGLIDTAVKTSRSGYLQRCLIKHLESISVHYDHTVRGADSAVYQFYYGGDGLDVTKQKHLYHFEFAIRNETTLVNRTRPKALIGRIDDETAVSHMKKAIKRPEKHPPTLSIYNPTQYLGSTSEKFAKSVAEYVNQNPDSLLKKSKEAGPSSGLNQGIISQRTFRQLMNVRYLKALVEPGEAVGLIASQGIGEPSTQMTLNTFHLAGHSAANVTLGIPRLREIVMTASRQPKTPNMTLDVLDKLTNKEVERFCKRTSRLTLSQIVDKVSVKELLTVENGKRLKIYTVHILFYPAEEYRREYCVAAREVLESFRRFAFNLKKEIQTELKRLDANLRSQIEKIGKGQAEATDHNRGSTEEVDGEIVDDNTFHADEVSEVGDGDADAAKRVRQANEEITYDDDSDEETDINMANLAESYEANGEEVKGNENENVEKAEQNHNEDSIEHNFLSQVKFARSFKCTSSKCVFALEFDLSIPKLLLVGVIERVCLKTVIREIPGIKECFSHIEEGKSGQPSKHKLMTNGSNYLGFWKAAENIADLTTMYSNDINATLHTYGVEMARASIIKEMRAVFDAYSITVDGRHLELIADYMTYDGGFKPFNRKGISTSSSPLLKASFETTASFISDATLHGDFDDLKSPSARIVLGRPSAMGTGACDVIMPIAA